MSVDERRKLRLQGTPEWQEDRLGKITASRFAAVITQPRSKAARDLGEFSETAKRYAWDKVAEILTGKSQDPPENAAMRWGTSTEPDARGLYEELTGIEVQEVGFITHPEEPMVGGSPDGLVGTDGGIEIKCPFNTRIHLGYRVEGILPPEYVAQVQGLLWITGREWWDFVSYDPRIVKDLRIAFWRLRVKRHESFIDQLQERVFEIRNYILEMLCQLKGG